MAYKDKEIKKTKDKEYRTSHREAIKKYQRAWYLRNKEAVATHYKIWAAENQERCREYERRYALKLKQIILAYYGNGKAACVRCGESRLPCLSIDHINGGGMKHRKSIHNQGGRAFYSWLKVNNLPEGYQTLCMNCQFMKKFANVNE